MSTEPHNKVSKNFGFLPENLNITNEYFSIQTLEDLQKKINLISKDSTVHKGWIFAPQAQTINLMTNQIHILPYKSRIFRLPKTHNLRVFNLSESQLEFLIWCLSFFVGMRLSTTEAGFLDATPLKPRKIFDFVLPNYELETALLCTTQYMLSLENNDISFKRLSSVTHLLLLAQNPQNLNFEKFNYLYMALDTCYKIVQNKVGIASKPKCNGHRVQWMCEYFAMPVPDWAVLHKKNSLISEVRNNTFHEALFFDEPLGFAIFKSESNRNVLLEMQNLICRFLVALLINPKNDYIRTPLDTRMMQLLRL
ncbi:hypothetical protein G9F31_06930 [Acinetobacter sp. 187]|uniref:hypothetical protein n=1 Tax=Acinetobacter lanii TaxID=2715163 RepID=UPI0014086E3D|nr:hypothetical protein [Acinetobacter lanii]NHC03503.1 hypothetical protein [Acinetobacter lanii]